MVVINLNQIPCLLSSFLQTSLSKFYCFNRRLTVSCLALINAMALLCFYFCHHLLLIFLNLLCTLCRLELSPLGAKRVFSFTREVLKLFIIPHGKGPLKYHMFPIFILVPTSYLKPADLNLCVNHFEFTPSQKGKGSCLRKSVPSTYNSHLSPVSPLNLSSNLIFLYFKNYSD